MQAPTQTERESELSLDLGETQIATSLASIKSLSQERRSAVRSVLVHTRSLLWQGNSNGGMSQRMSVSDLCVFLYGFEALASLPKLRKLTVELNDGILPVLALTVVLKSCKRIKTLVLNHVNLQGDHEDLASLESAIQKHQSFRHLALSHVTGNGAAVTALSATKGLQDISLASTAIRPEESLKTMSASTQIRIIELDDIPDLSDRHILWLWDAFASSKTLTEFSLQSQNLGNVAGEAASNMLKYNQSVQRVKLHLGRNWGRCACSMAKVLKSNKSMKSLDLLLYGKTKSRIEADIQLLAQALVHTDNHTAKYNSNGGHKSNDNNSPLKELRLCLDLDPLVDDPIEKNVIQCFDTMLQANHELSHLTIAEFGFFNYPICNSSMERKLRYNRSGISRLLLNDGSSHSAYLKAIANESDHLDFVFYALINKPSLFIWVIRANPTAMQRQRQEKKKDERIVFLQNHIQSALDVLDDGDDDLLLGNSTVQDTAVGDLFSLKSSEKPKQMSFPVIFPKSNKNPSIQHFAKSNLSVEAVPNKRPNNTKAWRRRVSSSLTGMLNLKS